LLVDYQYQYSYIDISNLFIYFIVRVRTAQLFVHYSAVYLFGFEQIFIGLLDILEIVVFSLHRPVPRIEAILVIFINQYIFVNQYVSVDNLFEWNRTSFDRIY